MKYIIAIFAMPFVGAFYLLRIVGIILICFVTLIYLTCRYGIDGADEKLDEILDKVKEEQSLDN